MALCLEDENSLDSSSELNFESCFLEDFDLAALLATGSLPTAESKALEPDGPALEPAADCSLLVLKALPDYFFEVADLRLLFFPLALSFFGTFLGFYYYYSSEVKSTLSSSLSSFFLFTDLGVTFKFGFISFLKGGALFSLLDGALLEKFLLLDDGALLLTCDFCFLRLFFLSLLSSSDVRSTLSLRSDSDSP